ncbi:MAG: 3-dehydroquinate synthase [Oscillospiraceae bacterium]|nr:3-dehydroquinate synthase [Oscillospiraceae bacterium]
MINTNTITVNTSKTYDIIIGAGLLGTVGETIRKTVNGEIAAIITDDIVNSLYADTLADSLKEAGYKVAKFVFPNGETSKNADNFTAILNFLATEKLSRTDVVIALGGGVVGDLAGFAAACYMRGVKLVQIPTTLLSAVDSSVGGKTAINLAVGKNLAGSFYQPHAVICDISTLATLPAAVFKDGCGEVLKYGVIADRALFDALNPPLTITDNRLQKIIARCVELKRDVVVEDEFETGVRKLLNFGHTVGHAIELLSNYTISHGLAVAAGMAVETRMARHLRLCSEGTADELLQLLKLYELPTTTDFKAADLARACLSDKKRDGGELTVILPVKIGECVMKKIPVNDLETLIRAGLEGVL